jgi:hypothetical protein
MVANGQGNQAALKGTNIDIETKGSGRLYYFWVAEGISSSGAIKKKIIICVCGNVFMIAMANCLW